MRSILDELNFKDLCEGAAKLKEMHEKRAVRHKDIISAQKVNLNEYFAGEAKAEGHGLWKVNGSAALIAFSEEGAAIQPVSKEGIKTILVVISGKIQVMAGEDIRTLNTGDIFVIEESQVYSVYCPKKSFVLAVTFPEEPSYPEGLEFINNLLNNGS